MDVLVDCGRRLLPDVLLGLIELFCFSQGAGFPAPFLFGSTYRKHRAHLAKWRSLRAPTGRPSRSRLPRLRPTCRFRGVVRVRRPAFPSVLIYDVAARAMRPETGRSPVPGDSMERPRAHANAGPGDAISVAAAVTPGDLRAVAIDTRGAPCSVGKRCDIIQRTSFRPPPLHENISWHRNVPVAV